MSARRHMHETLIAAFATRVVYAASLCCNSIKNGC